MAKAVIKLEQEVDTADTLRLEKQTKLVNIRKTLLSCKKDNKKKEDEDRIVCRGGSYYQNWTTPCPKFMKRFQPEKDDPNMLYREIR